MNRSRLTSLVFAAQLAVTGAVFAQESRPLDPVEPFDHALECSGSGLIAVVADQCMHDGGRSASGDSLEIYCYHGATRFCLSGEDCPWRGEPAGVIHEQCSRAGLDDDWMATAWCDGWLGYHDFACTEQGRIELRKEGRADIPTTCGAPD